MSLAPFWIADISTTLTRRTTGASSPWRERLGADLLHLLENLDAVGAFAAQRRLQFLEALARRFERAHRSGRARRARLAAFRAGRRGPALAGRVVLLDRFRDRDLRRDDRFDRVTGHELDVVHREDVRGIRHR